MFVPFLQVASAATSRSLLSIIIVVVIILIVIAKISKKFGSKNKNVQKTSTSVAKPKIPDHIVVAKSIEEANRLVDQGYELVNAVNGNCGWYYFLQK